MEYYLAHPVMVLKMIESEKYKTDTRVNPANSETPVLEYKEKLVYTESLVKGLVKVDEEELPQKNSQETFEEVETKENLDENEVKLSLTIAGEEYNKETDLSNTLLADKKIDEKLKESFIKELKWKFVKDSRADFLKQVDFTR